MNKYTPHNNCKSFNKSSNKLNFINLLMLINACILMNVLQISVANDIKDNNKTNHNLKIAIVKNSSLENCLYFKDIKKKWEKEFNPKGEQLQTKQKDFESKKNLFQRDRAILSDKERLNKENELNKLQNDLQHTYENLDMEVKSKQKEDLTTFNKFIEQTVSVLAKQKQYDLILPDEAVLYYNNTLDCTDELIKALDDKYRAKN